MTGGEFWKAALSSSIGIGNIGVSAEVDFGILAYRQKCGIGLSLINIVICCVEVHTLRHYTVYIVACQRGGVSNKPLGQRQDTGPGILWSAHRWTRQTDTDQRIPGPMSCRCPEPRWFVGDPTSLARDKTFRSVKLPMGSGWPPWAACGYHFIVEKKLDFCQTASLFCARPGAKNVQVPFCIFPLW